MLKKVLLLLSFFTLLNAQEKPYISLDYGPVPVTGNGELVMGIKNFSYTEYANKQVWVGIYKPGSSNAWENVQAWKWVPRVSVPFFKIDVSNLSAGDYDIRLFFNNSYKMEAQETFSIKASNEKPYISLDYGPVPVTGNGELVMGIKNFSYTEYANKQVWVGIYKPGTSNAWKNVQAWKWVPRVSVPFFKIDVSNLSAGNYDIRLFFNNSYKMEAQETFSIKASKEKPFI